MMPPELQPRFFRPYVSSFSSVPSLSLFDDADTATSFQNSYRNPNATKDATSSASRSRFSPSAFAHNPRIAVALLPCAAFLLDLGGTPVVATLIIGLMVAYILDSLNLKPAAFFAVWLSLLFAQIAFFFSSSLLSTFNSGPLAVLASFLCANTNFLVGVWASLQFKWVQVENPSIVLALERLLFASLPFIASSIFAWATISAVGITNASSYYLMAFTCLFYWLYSLPRLSSFKTKNEAKYHGGQVPSDNFILGPPESCFHTLHLLFFPLLFHVASHHSTILSSAASFSDVLLLFFIPFLFQLYASNRAALWWITNNPHQLHSIRLVNGAVALLFVVISLEIRVVFHAFGRYIPLPPPLNYLLVTTTLLGGAAAAGAYAMGIIADAFSSLAFTALAVIVSAAGALVIGFPIMVCDPLLMQFNFGLYSALLCCFLLRNCWVF